jgi:hypothetical protein
VVRLSAALKRHQPHGDLTLGDGSEADCPLCGEYDSKLDAALAGGG